MKKETWSRSSSEGSPVYNVMRKVEERDYGDENQDGFGSKAQEKKEQAS